MTVWWWQVYSIVGFSASVLLYAMAAAAEKGMAAKALVMCGSVVKGLTESLFMLMYAMVLLYALCTTHPLQGSPTIYGHHLWPYKDTY